MPAWVCVLGALISALVAALSVFSGIEAQRTGRLRFLFWHIPFWGERERSPGFFKIGLGVNYYRAGFFALLTLIFLAYLLEALGIIK